MKHGRNFIDRTGEIFGRLKVLEFAVTNKPDSHWHCLCECGNEIIAKGQNLTYGHTQSCGCLAQEVKLTCKVTHGDSRDRKRTREYSAWCAMKYRCYNPNFIEFEHYGGRGIRVCRRWKNSFSNFLSDMGRRPFYHSLDRKDVNGNYTPNNCRWATKSQQGNNTRFNRRIFFNGKTQTLSEWASQFGIKVGTLWRRLDLGWATEKAITKPTRKTNCV